MDSFNFNNNAIFYIESNLESDKMVKKLSYDTESNEILIEN